MFFVLSGPSGAGKDAVLNRMKEWRFPCYYVVTTTTRSRRAEEKHGIDYHFTSVSEFRDMVQRGEMLEWAEVYGNWYGVPKQQIKQALEEGEDCIARVDVQGAATIKKLLPQAVLVFLESPSVEGYEERLRQRNTESEVGLRARLESVEKEMKSLPLFDFIVMNHQGELDSAVSKVIAIVTAERCRVDRRTVELK